MLEQRRKHYLQLAVHRRDYQRPDEEQEVPNHQPKRGLRLANHLEHQH